VAPDRTPAYEAWGITLWIIQLPLFAALVYLSLRAPQPHGAYSKIRLERSRPT
jgi:hypothetical protein